MELEEKIDKSFVFVRVYFIENDKLMLMINILFYFKNIITWHVKESNIGQEMV
jgi:hypothetical protein